MPNNPYQSKAGQYPIQPVNLRMVDQAVVDYFSKRLNISVQTADNERFIVPILFAGSERWKSIRDGKGVRDANGTLILPVISVRRTDLDRDRRNALMVNEQPHLTLQMKSQASKKTPVFASLVNQRVLNGFPQPQGPEEITEFLTIPFPEFCTVHYEITIWSQYQAQMNEIIEQILSGLDYKDSFVMLVGTTTMSERDMYFVGYVDSNMRSLSNTEEMTDSERILRYSYTFYTPVFFILDNAGQPLSYGNDKGRPQSDNAPILYKQEGTTQILLTEDPDWHPNTKT